MPINFRNIGMIGSSLALTFACKCTKRSKPDGLSTTCKKRTFAVNWLLGDNDLKMKCERKMS